MEIKGILFDKDGTLIDFFEIWGRGIRPVVLNLLEIYKIKDSGDVIEKILKEIGVTGTKIDPEGSLAWKPYDLIAKDITRILNAESETTTIDACDVKQHLSRLFFEYQSQELRIPVLADINKLLYALHAKGIKTGIATTDEYESVKFCMEKLKADHNISFYGASGMGLPMKPDKELLFLAAKEWNIRPEEIAVVGDTPNDMRFAKNANAIGIGVLSGTGSLKDLSHVSDYIISSVSDLVALIEKLKEEEELHGKN